MTSIHTNAGAISALQTLRSIGSSMERVQGQVSSGLRVQTASDSAAYWSISTTMRSDSMAFSAVQDALELGAAKVETAYAGMSAVVDILNEFKAKLVAATEDGVDKAKIQEELDQLKAQVFDIAKSSSFSGQNWLSTDVPDIYDNDNNKVSVVSSFVRTSSGSVAVEKMQIHLSEIALFNSTGGGLLQADARDIKSIGDLRWWGDEDFDDINEWSTSNQMPGSRGTMWFDFAGPLVFDDPGDKITFDVIVDGDNDDAADLTNGMPGPHKVSASTYVEITRATIDLVNPAWNGVISTNTQYAAVLNKALELANAGASASGSYSKTVGGVTVHDPVRMSLSTDENRTFGLDGSYVEVANYTSTFGNLGGLGNGYDEGSRAAVVLNFEPFQVYEDGDNIDGVEVSFNFSVNYAPVSSHSFNRTYVNELLGKTTGKVETAEEMVTLLRSLLDSDWPNLVIETTSGGQVLVKSDPAVDRLSGSQTRIGFSGMRVSIEPLPTINFSDLDIVKNPDQVDEYITYIEAAASRVVAGTSVLGAFKMRIDLQTAFALKSTDVLDRSLGRLVDADLNEASTRLKALQTQEQLAIQSLQIANADAESILSLFR